ncbi:hypothetical protein [Brucella intermedia]|uniref:hypothetical protein n=1 Tax=Brucella intermedia TaxID=94625 RepID=UPI001FFF64ED|nr:hypothetical protein [Brucella intermedia]
MANWWESAPLVEQPKEGPSANWWDAIPLANGQTGENAPVLQDGSLNVDNTVRALGTGVPILGGLLNKMDAATNATLAPLIDPLLPDSFQKLPGDSWDERYKQAMDIQQGKDKAFEEQHPYLNTGLNITGGVAGTVPMIMAAPAAFGAGGGGLAARSAASAASGAAMGGADAAIRSDGDPEATKWGAGAGFAMGLAGPAVGQAVGAGVRKVSNAIANRSAAKGASMTPGALSKLGRAAADDGLDALSIRSQLDELGPDAMLMDLGPNLQRQAGALAATPGRGQEIVREAVGHRNAGANQRVISGLDDALGPVANPRAINDTIRQGQRDLAPAYEEAFKNSSPVDTSQLASRLDTQASVRRGPGQKAASEIRKWLNVSSDGVLDTNPYTLFQTRNAIDGRLATEADPQAIALYTNARQQIDELLARNVPGIKMADAQYQELARQNEGLRTGVKALDSGREALRPDELQQAITEGVNPEGLMVGPSGNTFRMQQAARADIDRQVGTKANDVVALRNVLKGEGDWNRDRIGMLFGQDRADKALNLLEREARFADTSHIVTRNSETAARNAAMQELGGEAAPKFGAREGFMAGGVSGAARSSVVRAVEKVADSILKSSRGANNTSLAEAISGNRKAVVDALVKVQQAQGRLPNSKVEEIARALLLNSGFNAARGLPGF